MFEELKEWGCWPEESRLRYYNHHYWQLFCKDRRKNPELMDGVFTVRDLTAHVAMKPSVDLSVVHEYYGHGSYVEFSDTGQRFRVLERELKSIEDEIVRDTGLSKITPDHSRFQEYKKLRGHIGELVQANILDYESFAYWLEMEWAFGSDYESMLCSKLKTVPFEYVVRARELHRKPRSQVLDTFINRT